MASGLVSGNKAKLIGEFQRLQAIHGRKWRRLLKEHNEWHKSEEAIYGWRNAKAGSAGNEVLRVIVADMKQIAEPDKVSELV